MIWLTLFFTVAILILINALYVAAEFSTVSSRRSRLSQQAAGGDRLAAYLLTIVESPKKLDAYVATCQVGITVSSLVLGFYGQGQIARAVAPLLVRWGVLTPLAAQSISATAILLLLTVLQALMGELVPKNIGIYYPERLALLTALPMRWSILAFKPLIALFNGSGQLIMRLFGFESTGEHMHIHAPEEIIMLVEESGRGGILDQEERQLLKNALQLRRSLVRQVMIPRTRMLAAPNNLRCDELLRLLADSPFSRVPLYKDSIDNIIGMVHLKDLLCLGLQGEKDSLEAIMHPVPFIPETMPVKTVISMLQRKHFQVAIVLDEYGGTAGMVTLEDLLEEIFGELQDEFDTQIPTMQLIEGERLWVRGDQLIEDVNELLGVDFSSEGVDTIGGLVLNALGHIPRVGEEMVINGHNFRVEKMAGRGVAAVSLRVNPEQAKRLKELIG